MRIEGHHFVLQGRYEQGWEDLTAEDTREAIEAQRDTYQENEGGRYRIRIRRDEQEDGQ